MLQDDSRELSKALTSKPDARLHAREAAQSVELPEPVAYSIYLRQHQHGYIVESLDDALDDMTNEVVEVTPLCATDQMLTAIAEAEARGYAEGLAEQLEAMRKDLR
jgi:hypothetical protein